MWFPAGWEAMHLRLDTLRAMRLEKNTLLAAERARVRGLSEPADLMLLQVWRAAFYGSLPWYWQTRTH